MLCSHLILPSNFRLTQIDGKHFSKNHPYFNACKEQVPRARPGYYDLRLTRHGKMVGCMAPISLGCPESDRCCKNDTTELIRWNTHTHVDIIHISYIYHIYIHVCVCLRLWSKALVWLNFCVAQSICSRTLLRWRSGFTGCQMELSKPASTRGSFGRFKTKNKGFWLSKLMQALGGVVIMPVDTPRIPSQFTMFITEAFGSPHVLLVIPPIAMVGWFSSSKSKD